MSWIAAHKRATVAIAGCAMAWAGIALTWGLNVTLMAGGGLVILASLFSLMED